jgi:hypothetical protein
MAHVEASLARRKKMAKKAMRRQVKEMEIAHRVRMGEDRDTVQEEYESEPLTDSDQGDRSQEEESESGGADLFVVKPGGPTGLQIPEGSRMSARVPKARKRIVEDDAALMEEGKRA